MKTIMKTTKDLITFLSKLDGDYPIPYVDKIVGANEDAKQVVDYCFTWINVDDDYVDCSFFKQKDNTYSVSIYAQMDGVTQEVIRCDYSTLNATLEECLRELYGTN